jgi:DNA (cytosine-5)-methyltransferase 1
MENVPDMALDSEMFILRSMVEELEQLGYGVEERVIETWRYGVPQFRQRLVLVALAAQTAFAWPPESPERVTVWNAIGDLPKVEGGWRPDDGAHGYTDYDGPQTAFQVRMRANLPTTHHDRVYDHITRPVREDDARAFDGMDTNTRYSDLPDDVKRYRDDIFDDKYKKLDENDLSRTITAHISKDGYWYIHPRQPRTITVREAARLQTFPDRYRFAGPPSAAFRQIGNAVPPALGSALAVAVTSALDVQQTRPYLTRDIAAALARWFDERDSLRLPWLRALTRWQLVTAAVLLDRSTSEQVRHVWPVLRMWLGPADILSNSELFRRIGQLTGRTARTEKLLELAAAVSEEPEVLDDDASMLAVAGVTRPVAELAVLAVPVGDEDENEEPVGAGMGVLRVAARFTGTPVDRRNKLTDGRLAVARLIGGGRTSRSAQLGLIELAATLCRPAAPVCPECPLQPWCRSSSTVDDLIYPRQDVPLET